MTPEQDRIATDIIHHHINRMREDVINLCTDAGVPMKTTVAILCASLVKEIAVETAVMTSSIQASDDERYACYVAAGVVLVRLLDKTFSHATKEDFSKIDEVLARGKT